MRNVSSVMATSPGMTREVIAGQLKPAPSKSVISAIRMFCAAVPRCEVVQNAQLHYLKQQQYPPE